MPEAIQYTTSGDSREGKAQEEAFRNEYNARLATFDRRWDYYNGNHDLPLKIQQDGYDDNVIVNHVESLADRITAFLVGNGVQLDAGGDETVDETDQTIADLWDANQGAILFENVALGGAIEGHNAVRLLPKENDDEYPRIVRIKQSHFTAFWDAFDMARVLWYRLQHTSGNMGKRIDYVRGNPDDQDAAGWTEVVYMSDKVDQANIGGVGGIKWTKTDERPWPYDWAPIVDWQNLPDPNSYYGKDEVSAAIRLNDALNFILSNAQRIVKYYASPLSIVIGANVGDIVKTQVGGLLAIPNETARYETREMQSDGNFTRWLADVIVSGLWESGGMVDQQNVKDQVGQLTNFGLRVLFANAIKRTDKKRLLYEKAIEAITKHALELNGSTPPEKIATIWPDVLPEDQKQEVETLTQEYDRQLISKQTYRNTRGWDHEEEEDRIAEERTTGDVGSDILSVLGQNRPFNRGA